MITTAPTSRPTAVSIARRRARLVLTPLAGAAVGAVGGFGGARVALADDLSSTDGWTALGAVIAIVFFGGVVTLTGYLTGVIVAVRRWQPPGARLAAAGWLFTWPLALAMAAGAAGAGLGTTGTLGGLLVLAATAVLFPVLAMVSGRLAPPRWLPYPVAAAVVGLVLVLVSA